MGRFMTSCYNIQRLLSQYGQRNKTILCDAANLQAHNRVNLHYWHSTKPNALQNLGDYLSKVVVDYLVNRNGLSFSSDTSSTRNLYAIGSIIQGGFQNATIWGSGFLNDPFGSRIGSILHSKYCRVLDVRAVRGPKTRDSLIKLGHTCPEVYGDPAIIMPLIYTPQNVDFKTKYSVVRHFTDNSLCDNVIPILTTDYVSFVDRICSSELIISSSLHGIILAETYGVPAVLYLPKCVDNNLTLYKYEDYYFGTGRYSFPVARTIEEALNTNPCDLPDFTGQQEILIDAFPTDLWY